MELLQQHGNPGIHCDNPNCDFSDLSVTMEETSQWLNKPCPKCGENLLTEEDLQRFNQVLEAVKLINSITPEQVEMLNNLFPAEERDISEEPMVVSVRTHKEIKIDVKTLR